MAAAPAAPRSRFLISESALKLSLTPPPSATPTGSVSCASSASSSSTSSFAVRRKQFRPTSVPADQPRVHDSTSLVSLGIVLVVSGAPSDSLPRRSLKRPHRAIDREPKDRHLDGQPREQPRYRPPPPDVPLPVRRRQRPTHVLSRKLPLYHHSRPLPPLPAPVDPDAPTAPAETHQATRSSGRTRRPPPRNLEHLIVAVSNTAKQRQGSPAKKRKVVVLAADEMDLDVDAESETGSKKNTVDDSTPPVEEESGRARRAARRSGGGKEPSVTPTPPPQVPAEPPSKSRAPTSSQAKKPVSASKPVRRVTRRNSDETSSEEKDAEAPVPVPSRRTSARKAGVDHADALPVSVRA